ncbi:MAG: hypothetical protein SFX72_04610 [Isosphaeraceae bacterium]|nr:hypothetical protein [Isosphaeraceae bacterium]
MSQLLWCNWVEISSCHVARAFDGLRDRMLIHCNKSTQSAKSTDRIRTPELWFDLERPAVWDPRRAARLRFYFI